MKKHWLKKHAVLLSVCIVVLLVAVGSVAMWMYRSSQAIYKRIEISAPTAAGEPTELEKTIGRGTDTELKVEDTFMKTMPVYEISPRRITQEEFEQIAACLDMEGRPERLKNSWHWKHQEYNLWWKENEISYSWYGNIEKPISKSDEELIEQAKSMFEILSTLPLFEGEYECLGIGSTQTVHFKEGSRAVKKRICFRRLIDGIRVIGGDLVDIYMCEDGVADIYMYFYDYTKTGELPMLSLEDAFDRVKDPDAFSLESEGTTFSGEADLLTVERVKLLFVNQYSDGCTILQPVFNLMGTAENETGKAEFSSKVIAIPDLYTYTE